MGVATPALDKFDVANSSWPDTFQTLYQFRNNPMLGMMGFDGDDHEIVENLRRIGSVCAA